MAVFLLTVGRNMGFYCADVFARYYMIDYLQLGFDQGLVYLFTLVTEVIREVDIELYNFVTLDGSAPMFMTSWMLTLFSHDTRRLEASRRVFDLMIVEHPLMIVYLSAAVIVEC